MGRFSKVGVAIVTRAIFGHGSGWCCHRFRHGYLLDVRKRWIFGVLTCHTLWMLESSLDRYHLEILEKGFHDVDAGSDGYDSCLGVDRGDVLSYEWSLMYKALCQDFPNWFDIRCHLFRGTALGDRRWRSMIMPRGTRRSSTTYGAS